MSMFREGIKPAPVSFKRVIGFMFASNAIPVGIIGALTGNTVTIWLCIAFIAASIVLAICTTVADIVTIINAAKELK